MTIAVLSGKGGTGKTLVSVNLAAAAGLCLYIDCDVEEPNGRLFFKPSDVQEQEITVKRPQVDADVCSGCRRCVDFCRFNAMAFIKDRPYIFEEVCHGCGGCALLCPEKAISEKNRRVGVIQRGISGAAMVHTGILDTGQASGIPVIKKLLEENGPDKQGPSFVDCPPGSACTLMESIKDADYCVLVAEPTRFGVHNLEMAYNVVRLFDRPHGVIINKCLEQENPAVKFCRENSIPIIGWIPFDMKLAALSADAKIAAFECVKYRALFTSLLAQVMKEARHAATVDP